VGELTRAPPTTLLGRRIVAAHRIAHYGKLDLCELGLVRRITRKLPWALTARRRLGFTVRAAREWDITRRGTS
jgi:hypothetical protein